MKQTKRQEAEAIVAEATERAIKNHWEGFGQRTMEELGQDVIKLPADVMFGYSTSRPELLSMVQRPMSQEEVESIMYVLAGQMRIVTLLRQEKLELEEKIQSAKGRLKDVANAVDDTISELKD